MNQETNNTTAIILSGDGYQLTIAPDAELRKLNLLTDAAEVVSVDSNDESADAMVQGRRLASMRLEVERCRKEIKEPVNRIAKQIDTAAKSFLVELEAEEARIKQLVGDHAMRVAKLQIEKEAEERKAFEAARSAKEAAAATGTIADAVAAKQALAARLSASEELSETKIAQGVRFAWDYELLDAELLHERTLGLTEVTVKRSAVLAWLKEWEEKGKDETEVMNFVETCGLRAFKKPVVASR